MADTTQAPPLEKIDSPRHRRMASVKLVVGAREGADYDRLRQFLGTYGRISLESKRSKPRNPAVGKYFLVRCTGEKADELKKLYHDSPPPDIVSVNTIEQTYEKWF